MQRLCAPLICTLLVIVGISCNPKATIRIYTTIPEVTLYAELYNAQGNNTSAIVVTEEHKLSNEQAQFDVAIAQLGSIHNFRQNLMPLKKLHKEYGSQIYPTLLEAGVIDNVPYLLPFAFNLPLIEFTSDNTVQRNQQIWITAATLQQYSEAATIREGSSLRRIGFVPEWSSEFLYALLQASGVDFSTTESEYLTWDNRSLQQAIQTIDQWQQYASKQERDTFFQQYVQSNLLRALKQDYIAYRYSTVQEFFSAPQAQRSQKDFFWFSNGAEIYTGEDIIYVGISKSGARQQSQKFLRWLLSPETQSLIIREKKRIQLPYFGIAGMLSSLPEINSRILPRYYQQLQNKVPAKNLIKASPVHIAEWASFKKEFLFPWLSQPTTSSASFQQVVQEWYTSIGK